jgi:hypothetical protein
MPDIREDFGHSCFILGLLPSGLIRGLSDAPDVYPLPNVLHLSAITNAGRFRYLLSGLL